MTAERGFALHPLAAQDITEIWEYIAEDNPLAARRVREEILNRIRAVVSFPLSGHRRRMLTDHGSHSAAVMSVVRGDHDDNAREHSDCDRHGPEQDFRATHCSAPNKRPPPAANGRGPV